MQAIISGAPNLPGRRPKNSSRQRRAKSSAAPYVVGEIFAGICGLSSAFMCREFALGYAIEIETDLQNLIRRRHPAARLYGDVKLVKELPVRSGAGSDERRCRFHARGPAVAANCPARRLRRAARCPTRPSSPQLTHLLCVSPPCQDVSVAGAGQGMQGQVRDRMHCTQPNLAPMPPPPHPLPRPPRRQPWCSAPLRGRLCRR
jgi:hypothetical protein